MSICSSNTGQTCVWVAFKKKKAQKSSYSNVCPPFWSLFPGYFWTLVSIQIRSLPTLNPTPTSCLNGHTSSKRTKFLHQNHFMEPVRQCQVRLQIERTQAKAELSQTTCNWQFTTYSSVLTKKNTLNTPTSQAKPRHTLRYLMGKGVRKWTGSKLGAST